MKLCSNRGGVNRVIALLLAAIAVMLVVVLLPAWDDLRLLSQRLSCEQAMKSAKDGLIIEYLGRYKEGSVQDAMNTLDQVMIARPNICPAGGEVYLIKNSDGIYEPLCGLHDRNERQRTRLNASRALELLREKRRAALRSSKGVEPDAVTITLNSQAWWPSTAWPARAAFPPRTWRRATSSISSTPTRTTAPSGRRTTAGPATPTGSSRCAWTQGTRGMTPSVSLRLTAPSDSSSQLR